ncbi:hypothetical protein CsatB_009811 [Cannabis sativa]
MANSSNHIPLLSQPHYDDDSSQSPHIQTPSLDSIIENTIGNISWAQSLQAILVSLAWFFDAQQTFISIFADDQPSSNCNNISSSSSDYSWPWNLPQHTSTISEWGLQCAGSILTSLPESAFFTGCLIGGFVLATIADSWLGRKKMLCFTCLAMAISTLLTAFANNLWTYSALRLICGFSRSTISTSALVLSTELVGKQWRGQVGVIGYFCYTLGFLSLPAIAYVNIGSTWRNLYLYTSIPTIAYSIIVYFFVFESPRWLFIKGEIEEGFGVGLVYYGMPLALGNLAFNNLYLSVTLNALSEFPASLIAFFFIANLNRRTPILVFCIISGICSIMSVVKEVKRQAIVVGGVFSPVLAAAGRGDGFVSYGVFGVVIMCFGLFVIYLPETKGRTICDTMDEEEYKLTKLVP